MKTIGLSEKTHKELMNLKLEEKNRNTGELVEKLIMEYRKARFLEASMAFKKAIQEKNIGFGEFLKKSRKIKEEIANEWFPK